MIVFIGIGRTDGDDDGKCRKDARSVKPGSISQWCSVSALMAVCVIFVCVSTGIGTLFFFLFPRIGLGSGVCPYVDMRCPFENMIWGGKTKHVLRLERWRYGIYSSTYKHNSHLVVLCPSAGQMAFLCIEPLSFFVSLLCFCDFIV